MAAIHKQQYEPRQSGNSKVVAQLIPDYQTLILPVLKLAGDKVIDTRYAMQVRADQYDLKGTKENTCWLTASSALLTFVPTCSTVWRYERS